MNESKKVVFDIGISFFASMSNVLIGFILTIILGKYLGAEDLGLYRMTTTVYGIITLIVAFGLPSAIIKHVAEFKTEPDKLNIIISSGIWTSLILGIIASILVYSFSEFLANIFEMPELSILLKILSLAFPFALVGAIILGLLNGLREMKKYGIAIISQSILMIVFSVILICAGFGIRGVVASIVLSSAGYFIFILEISKQYFKITLTDYIKTNKKILKFGLPLLGSGAINQINNQLDIILIGFFLVSSDVGHYTISVMLSQVFWIIPQSIQKITYPLTSEYWSKNNHSALDDMINKCMKYCTVILVPGGLFVAFFAKNIVTILFNESFTSAVIPLQILLVGTIIRGCMVQPISGSLSGIGRPDLSFKISTFIVSVNFILNIALIPYIGIIGAAIATTTSLILGAALNLYLIVKNLSINIDYKWFANILEITLFAVILFKLGSRFIDNVFILGLSILLVYTLIIFMFYLTKDDMHMVKSLLNYKK